MKFAALSAIALGAVSCYASAVPRQVGTQCTTGPNACCNSVQNYNEVNSNVLSNAINIFGGASFTKNFQGQLGISCSPITVIGYGANSCNNQAVCCEQIASNGAFGWNCNNFGI